MNKIRFLFIGLMIQGIVFLSCQEEKVITENAAIFEIRELGLPAVISTTSSRPVFLTAKVTHPQGSAGISSVTCEMRDSTGQVQLELGMHDDGDASGNNSGDVIAFDQIYTIKVIGTQLSLSQGTYQVRISAQANSGEQKQSLEQGIDIFPNQVPEIINYFFPDTVALHMPATEVQFTVNDNDGLEDVLWVIIQGFEAGISVPVFQDTLPNPQNNSPVFSMMIDSSYAARKRGLFELNVFAEDRVNDKSVEIIHPVVMENSAPELIQISVPDTMLIFATSSNVDTVRADVKDGQSLADILSFLPIICNV